MFSLSTPWQSRFSRFSSAVIPPRVREKRNRVRLNTTARQVDPHRQRGGSVSLMSRACSRRRVRWVWHRRARAFRRWARSISADVRSSNTCGGLRFNHQNGINAATAVCTWHSVSSRFPPRIPAASATGTGSSPNSGSGGVSTLGSVALRIDPGRSRTSGPRNSALMRHRENATRSIDCTDIPAGALLTKNFNAVGFSTSRATIRCNGPPGRPPAPTGTNRRCLTSQTIGPLCPSLTRHLIQGWLRNPSALSSASTRRDDGLPLASRGVLRPCLRYAR